MVRTGGGIQSAAGACRVQPVRGRHVRLSLDGVERFNSRIFGGPVSRLDFWRLSLPDAFPCRDSIRTNSGIVQTCRRRLIAREAKQQSIRCEIKREFFEAQARSVCYKSCD